MELAKYYEVFSKQAKAALETGVDLTGELLVILTNHQYEKKDATHTPRPAWRNLMVKIESGLTKGEYMKIILWDAIVLYLIPGRRLI